MTKTKIVLLAIAILVVGFVAGAFVGSRVASSNGGNLGSITNDVSYLVGDVYQGFSQTLVISKGTIVGPTAGNAFTALNITTSTTLAAGFDCQYDVVNVSTSTAAITLTLPTAAKMSASCLTQDGASDDTWVLLSKGNSFNTTIASSTGDQLFWNTSSTVSNVLTTSTAGSLYKLTSIRLNSSTILWSIGNSGTSH